MRGIPSFTVTLNSVVLSISNKVTSEVSMYKCCFIKFALKVPQACSVLVPVSALEACEPITEVSGAIYQRSAVVNPFVLVKRMTIEIYIHLHCIQLQMHNDETGSFIVVAGITDCRFISL